MNPSHRRLISTLFMASLAVGSLAACSDDDAASNGTNGDGAGGENTNGGDTPGGTAGCGKAPAKTGYVGSQSITVDGTAHTYELFLPAGYDGKKSLPLVLVFHGDGGTGANVRQSFPLEAAANGEAIIVYPDGAGKTWQIDTLAKMKGDIAFVDGLVAELSKTQCIDAQRVYATGFSKGAYFVNQLACRSKTAWSAIATHSGGGPFGTEESEFQNGDLKCANASVAALQVQGLADGTVGPEEGEKARDHWRAANGCSEGTSNYDPSPCVVYSGCTKPEVWCAIPDLGHTIWDKAATTTWAFFQK